MTPITQFLADHLSAISDSTLVGIAAMANVHTGNARRARAAAPISASDFLALMAACGVDPITRLAIPARRLPPFDHLFLAMGIRMRMIMRKDSCRSAAKAMGASASAVAHMRRGTPLAIDNIIKACVYLNVHPFDQCEQMKRAA